MKGSRNKEGHENFSEFFFRDFRGGGCGRDEEVLIWGRKKRLAGIWLVYSNVVDRGRNNNNNNTRRGS